MSKAKSGNIINISSIARHGNVGQVNYSASKAGVVGFTNAIASEFSRERNSANTVAPGFISTPMTDAMPDKAREAVLAAIPLEEQACQTISPMRFYFSLDLSSYITGQVIDVNGGLRAVYTLSHYEKL